MFSNFSIDKLTDSISSVALKTQENLTNAISNVNENIENLINDPNTKLSIKYRTRYIQEQLGTTGDTVSQLPLQYIELETKTDSIEKILKRILIVTKTYETEGYDYPPNLSESLSDWWSLGKDSTELGNNSSFLPRSFAQAISKASTDSTNILNNVNATIKTKKQNESNAKEQEDEDDEEDEDLVTLTEIFDSMSKCYKNIDDGKDEMDKLIINEFNKKLQSLIDEEFKNVHKLRKDVEYSRLKFDTLRYEVKVKELDNSKTVGAQPKETSDLKEESKGESKKETEVSEEEPKEESKEEPVDTESSDDNLLEQLEDEFVSNTSSAVEKMEELTDSAKILSLIKLYQNFQLVYYRQCVQEIEANLKILTGLEN